VPKHERTQPDWDQLPGDDAVRPRAEQQVRRKAAKKLRDGLHNFDHTRPQSTQTPMGTHTRLASAIKTNTRSIVMAPGH